jgi:hypothetical protein
MTAHRARQRTTRRILHAAWCRSGRLCRGDNAHARLAYGSVAEAVAAADSRTAVLAILHRTTCVDTRAPYKVPRGCQAGAEHVAALASQRYVQRLLSALDLPAPPCP